MKIERITFSRAGVATVISTTDAGGRHRESFEPGSDISALPAAARKQIRDHWTPEVLAAWEAAHPAAPDPGPVASEADRIVDALEAEGILTAAKARRIRQRLRGETPT